MNCSQFQGENSSSKVVALSHRDNDDDVGSISSENSGFDDPINDPSYEFSDSHFSDDYESSRDSHSDSNDSDSGLKSTLIDNSMDLKRSFQDNMQNQLDKNEAIAENIEELIEKNQTPQDSISNLEQPKKAQEGKKFQLSTYMEKKKRPGKKKSLCIFCESSVTNFERHLVRHHSDRKQVKDFLKFSKKSKERKDIIQLIRNDGNFREFLKGNVQPIYQTNNVIKKDYQPCAYCKGIYKKSFLYRHHKKCLGAVVHANSSKIRHLSASQTLVASALDTNNVLNKLRVNREVFGIMRADNISMVAKTDTLIYLYGEQYLKKHRRKQMAVVCSNKMRELARLLIELRKVEKNENLRLVDVIEPSMFETVVECAKRVGGYNTQTNSYNKSASLAAHYGTSLKGVCDLISYLIATKNNYFHLDNLEDKYNAVLRFKELINSQWTTEVSSLAMKDLNEKKWTKPVMLPLTKEIIKFKNYVTEIANKATATLKVNHNNAQEYKQLVNATLTLTVLYNRKRIGDVQYTKLLTYLHNFASSNQKEFVDSLSESEKMLTRYYKRIVTGGKGSQPVVILFPQNLQDLVNTMIEVRNKNNLVPESNEYLFAHPKSSRWVRADSFISQFAKKCGLEHPEHITSNKLRKQIATVMQILHLNENDAEQFARFMGHTGKTHDDFYKLSEDVYQTAKISKLLILMDKGEGQKYKGKSLEEIDINPEVDIAESESSDLENEEPSPSYPEVSVSDITPPSPQPSTSNNLSNMKCRKQSGRTPWTAEQIQVAKKYFKNHIQQQKAPNKEESERLKAEHPHLFHNKDWVRIKTFIYNTYRKK